METMNRIIRYTAIMALLIVAMSAAAQQNHTITCKVMPDQLREALRTSGDNVQALVVYEATAEGKHGNVLGAFNVGDGQEMSFPAGKQLILSHAYGGAWNVYKIVINGQTLEGSVVEYTGKNKFGYYDDFFYEVP